MTLDTAPGMALVTAVHTVLATAPDVGATLDTALGMAMLMALDTAAGMAVGTTAILSFSLHSEGNCSSALSSIISCTCAPVLSGVHARTHAHTHACIDCWGRQSDAYTVLCSSDAKHRHTYACVRRVGRLRSTPNWQWPDLYLQTHSTHGSSRALM